MPIRMLRDWTDSIPVNSISRQAEVLFVRLIMKADDFGRFHSSPKMLRSLLFPLLIDSVRDADCSRWIAECVKAGLVRVYQSDGKELLEIVNFGQRMKNGCRAKFPGPTDVSGNCRELPGSSGISPPESELELETESEQEHEGVEPSEADAATPPAVVLTFPVVVQNDGPSEWELRQDKLDEYRETYPGIDPLFEARKALQWIRDNLSKRKTYGGMTKYLNSWMSRAQDEAAKKSPSAASGTDLFAGLRQSRERRLGNDGR